MSYNSEMNKSPFILLCIVISFSGGDTVEQNGYSTTIPITKRHWWLFLYKCYMAFSNPKNIGHLENI